MATFDIIIPYYQRAPGVLSRALGSVARQSETDWHILLVDDASPCPPDEDLAGMAERDRSRVTVIRQANQGPAGARETGLRHIGANTAFVAFLDSDDDWDPDHLSNARQALDLSGTNFYWNSVGTNAEFDENYAKVSKFVRDHLREDIPGTDDVFKVTNLASLLTGPWYRFMHLSCTVLRSDLARTLNFDRRLRLCEDFDFFCRCANVSRYAVASDRIGVIRGQGDNVWHGAAQTDERYAREKYTMLRALKRLARNRFLTPADRAMLALRQKVSREQFIWAQRDRLRAGLGLTWSLWALWVFHDPALLGEMLAMATHAHEGVGQTAIPGDDI